MLSLAIFAVAWAIIRACVQSITLDEAATYRAFVATLNPNHWAPHSNNHVLNSMLMRLATSAFGLSQLSVRVPALAGTCIYVASSYLICRRVIASKAVRTIVFACLVLNPYLGDLYVAARGYSMALGFLAAAIAAVVRLQFCGRAADASEVERTWLIASGFLGLSFVANFPFALVNATTWAALLLWTMRSQPRKSRPGLWRLLVCSTAPGAAAVMVTASWTLLHWPSGQLFYGAHSLAETFRTIASGSLYAPNAEIANPLMLAAANFVRPFLVPVLCGFAAAHLALSAAKRRHFRESYDARKSFEFCLVLAGALMAALTIHWIGFRLFGLLLPRDRTGIYIIPLFTLATGALAGVPAVYKRIGVAARGGLVAMLAVLAVYYGLCSRSRYFIEWWSSADAKEVYYVLAYYNHRYDARAVASRLPLTDCLEFYRLASGRESLEEFVHSGVMPRGKDAYAGYASQDGEFFAREGLKIVYRGRIDSDVVVAVRPDLDAEPHERKPEL